MTDTKPLFPEMTPKPWYASKTVLGLLVAVFMFVKSKLHWSWLPEDAAGIESGLEIVAEAIGGLLALKGRKNATQPITNIPLVSMLGKIVGLGVVLLALSGCASLKDKMPELQVSVGAFGVTLGIDTRKITDPVVETVNTATLAAGLMSAKSALAAPPPK